MTEHIPEMREERADAIRSALVDTLRDEPRARAARTRRRVLVWGGFGAVALAGSLTAGALLIHAAPVSNEALVHCLSSASRNADGSYPGSQATIASESGEGRVEDATALCTQMWQQGVLHGDFEPGQASNPPGTVPAHLQVCVMPDGSAAVVPGESEGVCQAIGLAPLRG